MDELSRVFRLDKKVAVITGGGTGIGYAIAKCMTLAGAEVVIVGRRREVLENACRELGEKAEAIPFDIEDTGHAPELIREILEKKGRIDILVNNAGVSCRKPVEEVTQEDLHHVMDIHVMGAYALSQAVIPHMRSRGEGNIICISSMSSFIGLTDISPYAIAKSAVLGVVRSLAGEYSKDGIRVNSIAPGWIDTPMFQKVVDIYPERKEKILGRTPMKRFGTPEDIGWAAVYLAAPASKFVTGTHLIVDGGAMTGF